MACLHTFTKQTKLKIIHFYETSSSVTLPLLIRFIDTSSTYFEVKTWTYRKTDSLNKILQGEVLAPLLSSKMVDTYNRSQAMKSGNVYLYKNKVIIPPLTLQDDTLGMSSFG